MCPKGISVVIPCLNERATLTRAISDAQIGLNQLGLPSEIIVADNGSTDGSQGLAEQAGARVLEVAYRGYGSALHHGILAAKFSYVVFADADLSYPFQELNKLVTPLINNEADFVLGSRLAGVIHPEAMPLLNRYLGTPILSFLIRRLYGIPASDCNSGMRAILRDRHEELNLRCPGMEYASEMLIRVGQKNLRYTEVPISFYKDQRGRSPHLRRWRDGWRHLRFILGNASSYPIVFFPLIISLVFLLFSLGLSYQNYWAPEHEMHYHTAFSLIAVAVPLLMMTISMLLIKIVLHLSGQVESRFIHWIEDISERNWPILGSLIFFGLVLGQLGLLIYHWYRTDWGRLDEMGGVIRITIFSILSAALIALDMSIGILKLIPYRRSS